jgi:undecaprenyl-diphosphatase
VRSPLFVFRLVVGLVLTAVGVASLVLFENALLGFRDDIRTLQQSWPDWVPGAVEAIGGGAVIATFLVAHIVLLYRRRFRRVVLMDAAVIAAGALSGFAGGLVLRLATSDLLEQAIRATGPDASLGNKALAAIVAVLTISSPWIGRRVRPWVTVVVAGGYSLSFIGGANPVISLLLDIGVGMVAGSMVALVLGTHDRTPTEEAVAERLGDSGIDVTEIHRAKVDARGSVPWFATTAEGGRLFIKTLSTDHRAADLLFRLYRWLRLRRAGDRRPFASLDRAVEHEALMSLAAHSRGIRTPRLEAAIEIGTDGMLLAFERVEGQTLDDLSREQLTPNLLAEIWGLVSQLHEEGMAHRDLRLANVLIDRSGSPWLIDFGFAELAASKDLRARDVAELIGSTSVVVGSEAASHAAIDALGHDRVLEALPWIQPLALSTATRSQIGKSKDFDRLRTTLSEALGVSDVRYERMERVSPRTIFMFATIGLAAYVLIPQVVDVSGFLDELTEVDPVWAMVAMVASGLTYVGATIGLIGAIPIRLSFAPVLSAQVAASFVNRITPAKVGGMATNVRFLQRRSIPPSTAISAVGLNTVAGLMVHIALVIVFGVMAGSAGGAGLPIPSATTAAVVVGAVILASGLFMALPIGRKLINKNLLPALRAAGSTVAAIASSPRKIGALVLGSTLVTLGYTAAMLASLEAFGVDLAVTTAALVYLTGSAVATAAPTPGGVGATEAALLAGYTAVGVDAGGAFAAVLLFRLATFWLPILPGWLALVSLQRRGDL